MAALTKFYIHLTAQLSHSGDEIGIKVQFKFTRCPHLGWEISVLFPNDIQVNNLAANPRSIYWQNYDCQDIAAVVGRISYKVTL